jgi:hypothetical protein
MVSWKLPAPATQRYLEECVSGIIGSPANTVLTDKSSGHAQTASRAIKISKIISSRRSSLCISRLCAHLLSADRYLGLQTEHVGLRHIRPLKWTDEYL